MYLNLIWALWITQALLPQKETQIGGQNKILKGDAACSDYFKNKIND